VASPGTTNISTVATVVYLSSRDQNWRSNLPAVGAYKTSQIQLKRDDREGASTTILLWKGKKQGKKKNRSKPLIFRVLLFLEFSWGCPKKMAAAAKTKTQRPAKVVPVQLKRKQGIR